MNSLDAIYRVLKDAGEPLNYREITKRMLKHGLWRTTGRTPENTVNRDISQEISRLGKQSRFIRVAAGVYGLTAAASANAKAAEREDAGPAPLPVSDRKKAPVAQGAQASAVQSDLSLLVAAWPSLPSASKQGILEIVKRSQETGRSHDPVVAQMLPDGPKAFPAEFLTADVATGARVELPDEPIQVAWQPDGTDVVRSHFGFIHQVRNATEGRFILYAHLCGHRAVQVPDKMIHVFKAVKAYEQYLRGLWQDLFRAYGRSCGSPALARRQANRAFISLGLPLDIAEAIKEDEPVDARPPNAKRRRHGQRTPETQFYLPILQALTEMGGSGKVAEVLERVGEAMKGTLRDVDHQPLGSSPDLPRWRNTAQWARNSMMKEGLLKADSPRGVWEIADKGRALLR